MFYHRGHSDPGPRDRRRFQKRYGRFDYYDNDYDYDYYSNNNNKYYNDFITASKSDQYSDATGSYGGYR